MQEMIIIPAFVKDIGMKPKKENTVVYPWPTRLHKKRGEPSAQEKFARLKDSGSVGKHRFVEWVRNE